MSSWSGLRGGHSADRSHIDTPAYWTCAERAAITHHLACCAVERSRHGSVYRMMRAKTRRLRLGIRAAIEQTRTIACSPGTRVRSQCSAFCRSHHIERALFAWQSPSLNAIARKDAASVSPRRHERETGSADTDSACKLRTAHRRRTQRDDPGRMGQDPPRQNRGHETEL